MAPIAFRKSLQLAFGRLRNGRQFAVAAGDVHNSLTFVAYDASADKAVRQRARRWFQNY